MKDERVDSLLMHVKFDAIALLSLTLLQLWKVSKKNFQRVELLQKIHLILFYEQSTFFIDFLRPGNLSTRLYINSVVTASIKITSTFLQIYQSKLAIDVSTLLIYKVISLPYLFTKLFQCNDISARKVRSWFLLPSLGFKAVVPNYCPPLPSGYQHSYRNFNGATPGQEG